MHYNIRVVLNNLTDPMCNFPQLLLTNVIRTSKEINYMYKNSILYCSQMIII